MNSASDLLTSSETLTTNARSALGIDSATGSRDADLDATFEKYAVPGHVGAAPDLEAEAGPTVEELLTVAALTRALMLALARARAHTVGGFLGLTASALTLMSIQTDPALDVVLSDQADALLAHADSLLHAVPSEPSDAVRESERIAEEVDDVEVAADDELKDEIAAARAKRWAPVPTVADDVQEAA